MNDETKKDDYYREQWAKIQVEKHNSKWSIVQYFLAFYVLMIVSSIVSIVVMIGIKGIIWIFELLHICQLNIKC